MDAPEFLLNQKGIQVIRKYIANDPSALRNWPVCINIFAAKATSRKRLQNKYKNGEYWEVIIETLEEWLQQDNNATFGKLIQLLRDEELNYLCDKLLENWEMIQNAQLESKKTPSHIQNFWFGMTDVANFVGRVEELERLHKLVVTENHAEGQSSAALLTSVHGLGGIGKTTLAKMYAWKYRNDFDGNVIWIDSETFGSLQRTFERVAGELNLDRAKITKLDLQCLAKAVYKAFVDSKCLFIFHNVEQFHGSNGIKQFLPTGIKGNPYLLLTSRSKDSFSTNRVLVLDVLNVADSVRLIKGYIPGATDKIAVKLAQRLERVPLAIHQAIGYIQKSIPAYSLSSEKDVFKAIHSFLEEYENNSNTFFKSELYIGEYAKTISLICEMSLRKMERKEGGKLAKHMLRYISFLHQGHIKLDFVLNLDYNFESILDKLQRLIHGIPWNAGKATDPNMTVDLLCSYSLIDINVNERIIKVHRLVQDVIRRALQWQEELLYVKRLLEYFAEHEHSEHLSHWISVQRSCKFETSKSYVNSVIPRCIELLQPVFSAGLNIYLSKKLVEVVEKHTISRFITPILLAMKADNINISVGTYLSVYKKVESALDAIEITSLVTNYILLSDFIISEKYKNLHKTALECISILRMKKFKTSLLLELLGESFPYADKHKYLDILSSCGILVKLRNPLVVALHTDFLDLLDRILQIPASLSNEFPCINCLKPSSTFNSFDELQALNLSWDYKISGVWPLFNYLEFDLEAVRTAIAYICNSGCTITEYLKTYNAKETEKHYIRPENI